MNGIDIVFGILFLFGAFHGFRAGFLLELFSLLAVILGILGGFKLMGFAMVALASKFDLNERVLPYIAFALVFILIVIVVNLLGKLLKASADKSFLGLFDSAAGALLGLLRTAFMLSIVLWIVDSLKFKLLTSWTEGSRLYPIVADFAPKLTAWIGGLLPGFKDVL